MCFYLIIIIRLLQTHEDWIQEDKYANIFQGYNRVIQNTVWCSCLLYPRSSSVQTLTSCGASTCFWLSYCRSPCSVTHLPYSFQYWKSCALLVRKSSLLLNRFFKILCVIVSLHCYDFVMFFLSLWGHFCIYYLFPGKMLSWALILRMYFIVLLLNFSAWKCLCT